MINKKMIHTKNELYLLRLTIFKLAFINLIKKQLVDKMKENKEDDSVFNLTDKKKQDEEYEKWSKKNESPFKRMEDKLWKKERSPYDNDNSKGAPHGYYDRKKK